MTSHLVWACNPSNQFEYDWIKYLLCGSYSSEIFSYASSDRLSNIPVSDHVFLVESGLIRLRHSISQSELLQHDHLRKQRLHILRHHRVSLIHLSDEEGFDGDSFYSLLSSQVTVFRNFFHKRFLSLGLNILTFPIGPRGLFLSSLSLSDDLGLTDRAFPWSFMGTLWSSGSRSLAVSSFLRSLPHGYFFGGKSFGQGLPLPKYRSILLNSHFALAPEGDRHLDTFRLWESLCCGCIPVVVDTDDSSHYLLRDYPLPIYDNWAEAHSAVSEILYSRPIQLPFIHCLVHSWWLNYIRFLREQFSSVQQDVI